MRTNTDLVLILNSDVVLTSNALEIMSSEMVDPKVGVVAPMLIFPADSEWGTPGKIQHIGLAFNIRGEPIHLFIGWSPDNPRAFKRRDDLSAVTGACMLVRRHLFVGLGGFNEMYGRGTFEDIEMCLLIKSKGYKIIVNPSAYGSHSVGQSAKTSGGYPLQQNFKIFQARMGSLVKNDDYKFL